MEIRNIGILAHVDAGKTTLSEQMLFTSGALRCAGRVDAGNAQTDSLDIERARGISVRACSVSFTWNDTQINLIDTPGHVDFASEVERCLGVLDGAVLIVSARDGVQAHTLGLYRALKSMQIPTIICVNKIDLAGIDVAEILENIQAELGCVPVRSQWIDDIGTKEVCVSERLACAIESLSMAKEEVLQRYMDGEPLDRPVIVEYLKQTMQNFSALPVLFAGGLFGVGISELLTAITELIPPADTQQEQLGGVVYKVEHDKTMGRIAHVRLFGGHLQNRDEVHIKRLGTSQKITQIRRIQASKMTDTGTLSRGDIAVLCGLGAVETGDILGEHFERKGYKLATPLLQVQVSPNTPDHLPRMVSAMTELAAEDSHLQMQWQPDVRQMHISIMGTVQLEILAVLLKERYDLDVVFSSPSVIYKETPAKEGYGHERYTMPKPCWADVQFLIQPGPLGSGLCYQSKVPNKDILYRYQEHIATSVPRALKQGLQNWEVTDLRVTLIGGEYHAQHTHPLDFFVATPMGIMNGLQNCGTTLLEPIVQVRIAAAQDFLGTVIKNVLDMRGIFDSPVIKNDHFMLDALLPVATAMNYITEFAILTGGKGVMDTSFHGYGICPDGQGQPAQRRGINPLDRAKWILHARSAL